MKETWLPTGSSDPLTYICTCPCSSSPESTPGEVLLFYRYYSNHPTLPSSLSPQATDPSSLATFHTSLTQSLHLGGKIRVAKEGFNVTVGGTKDAIETYIKECIKHWSFAGLSPELSTPEQKKAFFKPTPGCACVFGSGTASVRVCAEITPMGVTDYTPSDWNIVQSLSPAEFHGRCWGEGKKVLVDVRNHYESRIGYFIHPQTGIPALRPCVRRFGQWPQFVRNNIEQFRDGERTQYMTYCTGGIRCEKGARYLAESLQTKDGGARDRVCTLRGGIQAYLMWMDEEVKAGRKTASDSLFKGKTYVFDARRPLGLEGEAEGQNVAECHMCQKLEDRLSKCRSRGCHLILVICESCEEDGDPRCCADCEELDIAELEDLNEGKKTTRRICACEKKRELKLWGDSKAVKSPKPRKGNKTDTGSLNSKNMQIQTID